MSLDSVFEEQVKKFTSTSRMDKIRLTSVYKTIELLILKSCRLISVSYTHLDVYKRQALNHSTVVTNVYHLTFSHSIFTAWKSMALPKSLVLQKTLDNG